MNDDKNNSGNGDKNGNANDNARSENGGDNTDSEGAFDLRGLIDTSLLEWEDHVAAVAIAGGCNLRCPFCHSWRYVTGLADLRPINPDVLFALLERQRGWIDGVVFSGGEPTLQPGLAAMIRRVRQYGPAVKLHSNGSRPEILGNLLREGLLDCLALDCKAPLETSRFFAAAGVREDARLLDAVRESFRLAATASVGLEYHTTLVPGLVDADALRRMAEDLAPRGVWMLQQFENDDCLSHSLAGSRRYSGDELEALAETAREAWGGRVVLQKGKTA